jgi:probable F420-dependent oxidoreductase
MSITIGALIVPQNGDMAPMRKAWMEAEALGVDRLYTADHFFAPKDEDYAAQHRAVDGTSDGPKREPAKGKSFNLTPDVKNFEATTIEAAMCATTTRAEIGCLVHCNAYRNPNLLADMARTMDHISNGRFVLGIGSGFHTRDFEEYGYELGTFGSRLQDLDRDLDVIKDRWTKLNPQPTRKIPILMAGGGEKVALKIVAKHADEWHYFGSPDYLQRKSAVLDEWCVNAGRDPKAIKRIAVLGGTPEAGTADEYLKRGFTHLIAFAIGPDWDLTQVKDLVAWRNKQS